MNKKFKIQTIKKLKSNKNPFSCINAFDSYISKIVETSKNFFSFSTHPNTNKKNEVLSSISTSYSTWLLSIRTPQVCHTPVLN